MADHHEIESQFKQHKIQFLCCIFAILVFMIVLAIYVRQRIDSEIFVLERPKVLNELNLQPTNNPNTP
jgi:hypothetical protein